MTANLYIARSKAIAARPLGDEMMVMSASSSTLFTMNEVARSIWEAADGVTSLERIVTEKICAEYDVEPEIALKDAQVLVEQLAGHGLLLLSDQPIESTSVTAAGNP